MAKSSRGGRRGGGGGVNPGDIKSTSNLIVDPSIAGDTRNQIQRTLKDYETEYGISYENTRLAELKGKSAASVLAYYDGGGIAFNKNYADSKRMQSAMEKAVNDGYHPKLGGKSGLEAVAAHELGHQVTDLVAGKMGITGPLALREAATRIVNEARKITGDKGVVIMASKISKYAATSNAEAVAEAMADVYCNGSMATAQSRAIKQVVDSYMKKK